MRSYMVFAVGVVGPAFMVAHELLHVPGLPLGGSTLAEFGALAAIGFIVDEYIKHCRLKSDTTCAWKDRRTGPVDRRKTPCGGRRATDRLRLTAA